MAAVHSILGWVLIWWRAAIGLWGVGSAVARRDVGSLFALGTILGLFLGVVEAVLGVWMLAGGSDPGSFHVFYGAVVVSVVAFAYIYRAQLAVSPGLRWGLLLLFVAGLGLRGVQTFGASL
jgi:hypothetical protein